MKGDEDTKVYAGFDILFRALTVRKDGLGKQSCLTSTREVIIYFTLVL
jgi:hypothetical protein